MSESRAKKRLFLTLYRSAPPRCAYDSDVHYRGLCVSEGAQTASLQARHIAELRAQSAVDDVRRSRARKRLHLQARTDVPRRLARRKRGSSASRSATTGRRPSGGCGQVEVEIDQDAYAPPENVTFSEWADRWLAGLRREETTRQDVPVVARVREAGDRDEAAPEGDDVGRRGRSSTTSSGNQSEAEAPARGLADDPGEAPASPRRVSPGGEVRAADRGEPRPAARAEREAEGAEEAAELLHGRGTPLVCGRSSPSGRSTPDLCRVAVATGCGSASCRRFAGTTSTC